MVARRRDQRGAPALEEEQVREQTDQLEQREGDERAQHADADRRHRHRDQPPSRREVSEIVCPAVCVACGMHLGQYIGLNVTSRARAGAPAHRDPGAGNACKLDSHTGDGHKVPQDALARRDGLALAAARLHAALRRLHQLSPEARLGAGAADPSRARGSEAARLPRRARAGGRSVRRAAAPAHRACDRLRRRPDARMPRRVPAARRLAGEGDRPRLRHRPQRRARGRRRLRVSPGAAAAAGAGGAAAPAVGALRARVQRRVDRARLPDAAQQAPGAPSASAGALAARGGTACCGRLRWVALVVGVLFLVAIGAAVLQQSARTPATPFTGTAAVSPFPNAQLWCCDAGGFKRCPIVVNPGPPGSQCFCPGQGMGIACQ